MRVHMLKLAEEREITPYTWVSPTTATAAGARRCADLVLQLKEYNERPTRGVPASDPRGLLRQETRRLTLYLWVYPNGHNRRGGNLLP
jgi:hypothetical protein